MLSAFAFLGVLGILTSVRPQMVGFGSEQGLSNFYTDCVAVPATAGVAVPATAGVAVPALAGVAGYVERA